MRVPHAERRSRATFGVAGVAVFRGHATIAAAVSGDTQTHRPPTTTTTFVRSAFARATVRRMGAQGRSLEQITVAACTVVAGAVVGVIVLGVLGSGCASSP